MTLKEIVRQWLTVNGFDGLFHPGGECACVLRDLSCPGEGCEWVWRRMAFPYRAEKDDNRRGHRGRGGRNRR